MDGRSRGQQPVWMYENTSFETKYASVEPKNSSPFHNGTRQGNMFKLAGVRKTDKIQTSSLPLQALSTNNSEFLNAAEVAITTWIVDEMTATNTADLITILSTYQNSQQQIQDYNELQEFCQVILQLSSDLPNIFDNYLCFSGTEDQLQMKSLCSLALARASSHLKAKSHFHGSVTEKLLELAYDKLVSIYLEENQKMCKNEQEICSQATDRIINSYEEKMNDYFIQGVQQIEAIHIKLVQQCVNIMNKSLDFNGKINNVHTEATSLLETALNRIFLKRKNSQISQQQLPVKLPKAAEYRPVPTGKQQNLQNMKANEFIKQDKVCSSALEYRKIIDGKFEHIVYHKELRHLHDISVLKLTDHLSLEEREAVFLVAKQYFSFVSERLEELHFVSPTSPSLSTKNCICVQFSDDGIQFGAIISNEGKTLGEHWKYDPSASCARTTLRSKGKVTSLDFLSDFSSISPRQWLECKNRKDMVAMLRRVRREGEKVLGKLDHAFFVVPAWLDLDQRAALRELAHEAYFRKTSFLGETSLAAYSILCKTPGVDGRILVGINIGINGVFIEVYLRNRSELEIKLLTSAEYQWELKGFEGKLGGIKKMLYFSLGGTSRNWRKSMTNQSNPVKILCDAFDKAMARLGDTIKGEKKHCFLLTEPSSAMWDKAYQNFLKMRSSQVVDVGSLLHNETSYALKRAIELAKQPEQIRDVIVDHSIFTDETESMQNMQKIRKSAFIPISQQTIQEVGENIIEIRKRLLEKCAQMRTQLDNGQVRLAILTRKLVLEAIDKAERVGQDISLSEEEVNEQSVKISEHIKHHKFCMV